MIRRFGILNDRIEPGDAFLYGVPYPGAYVTDEQGRVIAKSFHDTYKKRDSPEILLDAALGRVELDAEAPSAVAVGEDVRVTAAVRGGRGSLRQGIVRKLLVRFEPSPGLHLYGAPVPEGMVPTSVTLEGPEGVVALEPVFPPTKPLRLPGIDAELPVFDGTFDVEVPFYADGRLVSETRPLDAEGVTLTVLARYQACDDEQCLLPRTERLEIAVPLDVVDVPKLGMHRGHGQREGRYDASPHLRRMLLRSVRQSPLGFLRFIGKQVRLELAARRRRRESR